MDNATVLAALKRHWEPPAADQDAAHEIYHDDVVLEFPQSRERFEGKANFIAWRRMYPSSQMKLRINSIRGSGDFWVAENVISYGGGPWICTCSILEFRGEKVARETIYVADGWHAPDWRAPWRSPWRSPWREETVADVEHAQSDAAYPA